MLSNNLHLSIARLATPTCACVGVFKNAARSVEATDEQPRPNIFFLLTDDQRWDGYRASWNERIHTPNLDRIAAQGTRFENAFVTLAICSPSRAACLTGRYGSASGVTAVGNVSLNEGETTFAAALRDAGYATGVTGKWHLKTTTEQCGFEFVSIAEAYCGNET